MWVKFWGVRGSIPCPGPTTVRYGGNTACIELMIKKNNRRIIIDAGTGIRELGNALMHYRQPGKSITADIFLTHTHWDHIMGFPFFTPIYLPTTQLRIHGPVTYEEETLKDVLGGQWTYRYFPVRHEELASQISYVDLKEGDYDLGQGISVRTKFLNHPLLCLGYRFEFEGKVFCTLFDTEPFSNVFITEPQDPAYDELMAAEGEQAAAAENQRIEAFVENADLLVYDAQYTLAEYRNSRIGWGHTAIEHAIETALRNKVKRLALFHHDIQRDDDQLDRMKDEYCTSGTNATEIFFASEGMKISL
ncbi:MAG: MBL fold metallo-hydrolase [Desulfobacteraceae bacterium]|nr:MBL fold metallo-hydrolase [Desulfobacteraceae bacterium]